MKIFLRVLIDKSEPFSSFILTFLTDQLHTFHKQTFFLFFDYKIYNFIFLNSKEKIRNQNLIIFN